MRKITWRKPALDDDGKPIIGDDDEVQVITYHGVNLGPVVKVDVTLLVVYCEDGRVREVPIADIVPY